MTIIGKLKIEYTKGFTIEEFYEYDGLIFVNILRFTKTGKSFNRGKDNSYNKLTLWNPESIKRYLDNHPNITNAIYYYTH